MPSFYLTSHHVTYGLEVRGAAHKTVLNKVMVLQKKITRIILNLIITIQLHCSMT